MADTNKKVERSETQVVETREGDIRITQPKGSGQKRPRITVLLEPDDLVRQQAKGFLNFLREHAVVGLAVGFIIGLQAQTMMKQLVESFVTPALDFLLGKELADKQFVLHSGHSPVVFTWGKFLYAFINFLIVVLVVYLIVKILRLDRLDKPKKD